jgi:nitroreductase
MLRMNSKLDWIFRRRSVRTFRPDAISPETVQDLLEAAMAAPSAAARDPWHFIVVREADLRRKIADALPYGGMVAKAPLGIVVLGDVERANDRQPAYLLQDVSAAIENLLLAASTLGLGAVWLGVHPRADRMAALRSLFKLPESILPVAVLAIGYPAEQPPPRSRYRAEAVHEEGW